MIFKAIVVLILLVILGVCAEILVNLKKNTMKLIEFRCQLLTFLDSYEVESSDDLKKLAENMKMVGKARFEKRRFCKRTAAWIEQQSANAEE